jgi:hypothetical protein
MKVLRKDTAVLSALLFGAVSLVAPTAFAAEAAKATDTQALAKASQNPVSNMISVPIEVNNTWNNGVDDVYMNVTNVKPVVPMEITKDWILINRAIIPMIYQDGGVEGRQTVGEHMFGQTSTGFSGTEFTSSDQELDSQFGLGDITYQGFFSPKKAGKIIWGIGPQLNIPTGTDRFTADQWALGPAAVVLTMPGHWVMGALVSNVWNIGNGYNNAADVDEMILQPFINYNMKGGWYINTAPVMTANWEADSGDQWTVPLGGGVGRVMKIGNQHVNLRIAGYYNVEAPDGNDDVFNLQLTCMFLFPKGK